MNQLSKKLKKGRRCTSESETTSSYLLSERSGDEGMSFSFNRAFSLSLLASSKAFSSKAFASWLSSLMNFSGDGQTSGAADEGSSRAAHALCLFLRATVKGILLQRIFTQELYFAKARKGMKKKNTFFQSYYLTSFVCIIQILSTTSQIII